MKVSELIEKLKSMPQEATVVLCDSNRMAYEATGETSSEGLYYDFDIFKDDETFFSFEDEDQEDPILTVVFSFETDYEEKAKELIELDAEIKTLETSQCKGNC